MNNTPPQHMHKHQQAYENRILDKMFAPPVKLNCLCTEADAKRKLLTPAIAGASKKNVTSNVKRQAYKVEGTSTTQEVNLTTKLDAMRFMARGPLCWTSRKRSDR